MSKQAKLWWFWGILSILLVAGFTYALSIEEPEQRSTLTTMRDQLRKAFLPGPSTHGHHQIEMACGTCHTDSFGEKEVLQNACTTCHEDELKAARDSHPRSKFTDPRNAARTELLDARWCVTCHIEHKPEQTLAMGLTLQQDYCVVCHEKVGEERPSHEGMSFMTCADAGCHNYHDNTALYEAYLFKHADQPAILDDGKLPQRNFVDMVYMMESYPIDQFPIEPVETPDYTGTEFSLSDVDQAQWLATKHAQKGVNCNACHQATDKQEWVEKPGIQECQTCHNDEAETFKQGQHGVRLALGLAPMTPAQAQIPMHQEAAHLELGCSSCHSGHQMDTQKAAAEACLGCHADDHSQAYENSKHANLWKAEVQGLSPAGTGVSCASCHMPRIDYTSGYIDRILVQHNQNMTLQPNEKMIRTSCQTCHGLQFSIDSLADTELIKNNFNGLPSNRIESIDLAVQADARDKERRK